MTKAIRAQYLDAASQLERSFLLAYDEGFPSKTANWNVIYQKFDELKALYKQAAKTLVGRDLEEVKKAHNHVEFVFPLRTKGASRTYDPDAKQLHYLRIALEHNLSKLVPKYFTQLTYESQSLAFELLCTNFGCHSSNKETAGMSHIAKSPLNLLAPAKGVKDNPRIIDVMLQGKTPISPTKDKKKPTQQEVPLQSGQQTYTIEQFEAAIQEVENTLAWLGKKKPGD